jgi:hypothetical protein
MIWFVIVAVLSVMQVGVLLSLIINVSKICLWVHLSILIFMLISQQV